MIRRVAKWAGFLLLGLVLLLGAALAWVNSAGGLRTLARLAGDSVPGLRLEGLRGPLPWRLAAHRIGYADAEGAWLQLDEAELVLDLPALLQGSLHIPLLQAARLAISRLPAGPPTAPTPPADTVLPQMPRLPLALDLDRLAVARIELGAPVLGQPATFSLEAQAEERDETLRATLDLVRLDAPGRVELRLALMPGDRLQAEITAEDAAGGPIASLSGQPDRPLWLALRLEGPASGAALTLDATLGEGIGAEASGTVSATAAGALAAQLTGEARAGPLLPPRFAGLATPLRFGLDAALSPASLLDLRALTLEAAAGRARASGSLDLASEAADLALSLTLPAATGFAALLPPGLGWTGVEATARLTGTLARPQLAAEVRPEGLVTGTPALDAALGPTPRLNLTAALPEQRVALALDGAEASLRVAGLAAEALDLTAGLELPRLAALGPGFEGSATLAATLRGRRDDPDITLRASSGRLVVAGQALEGLAVDAAVQQAVTRPNTQASVEGRYAGLPLSLALRARPEGDKVVLERAEAGFGPARLTATGSLELATKLFTGTARLDAPELARFAALARQPGLAGRVTLDARLAPKDGAQGFDARLEAPSLAVAGQAGSLRAQVEGTPENLGFTLGGQTAQARLATQGRAGMGAAGWRLDLASLEAGMLGETLRLAGPARIAGPAGGGIEIGALALTTGRGGRLEAQGRWGTDRVDLTARLAALPLALAQAVAPAVALQGQLDGDLRATGSAARPEVLAHLAATGLRMQGATLAALPPASVRAEARVVGQAMTLTAEAEAGAIGRLRTALRLPRGTAGELEGTLDGALDIAPLAAPFLAGGADRVAGRLTLALRAGGSLASPALTGRASLANGRYRNPVLGVRLNDIAGNLVGDGAVLRLDGVTAHTEGGGRITLAGTVEPGAPDLPVDIRLTARDARPIASDLVTATLDADLQVAGPLLGAARASGTVTVKRADIRVPERLPATVASLPDIRQRGPLPPGRRPPPPPAARGAAAASPLELGVQVTVRRAFIRGRGLDAELAGEIGLGGTVAAPVVTGGLQMSRGTLSVLARQLTFQRGNISFASGTLTPQLDFAAQTTASNATLTVAIAGTPQAPSVTFSSSPELPQDEILARLIFDRATSNLSPFEIAQLAGAAAELTGAGGTGGLVDRLRGGLGLDRLGLTSDPTNASGAAVEAGRYVAPGLYLGVRQGSGGNTGVGVQLELTPRLKLEGQTATGPGGDRVGLSYELEY